MKCTIADGAVYLLRFASIIFPTGMLTFWCLRGLDGVVEILFDIRNGSPDVIKLNFADYYFMSAIYFEEIFNLYWLRALGPCAAYCALISGSMAVIGLLWPYRRIGNLLFITSGVALVPIFLFSARVYVEIYPSPFLEAWEGDYAALEWIAESNPEQLLQVDGNGHTVLYYAAAAGRPGDLMNQDDHLRALRFLLTHEDLVSYPPAIKDSVYVYKIAIWFDWLDIFNTALGRGYPLTQVLPRVSGEQSASGMSIMSYVTYSCRKDILKLIKESGYKPDRESFEIAEQRNCEYFLELFNDIPLVQGF